MEPTNDEQVIISQGAEAKIYLGTFNGQQCLIKERFIKHYRHPDLDKQLTKERIRAETKAITRSLAAGVHVPKIYNTDLNNRTISMEYFPKSIMVKQYLNDILVKVDSEDKRLNLLTKLGVEIGTVIGKLHSSNIIHGDLTTSNMLLNPVGDDNDKAFDAYELIMIDFGLASYSESTEDKGVDLYVLERALLSTHSGVSNLFNIILEAYKDNNQKNFKDVIAKFEDVRARGRKRTMVG